MGRQGMTYDAPARYAQPIGPRYAPIAEALVRAAGLRASDNGLELGAGTGLVTERTADAVRHLLATDSSKDMLDWARKTLRGRPNVSFAVVDYTAPLPFLDASFSIVLSGLTYVQDSPAALKEVSRVLEPGGRLALSMWGQNYHEKTLLNAALESVGGGRFPPAAPSAAVRRLERAGFTGVHRTDVDLTTRFESVGDYLEYRRGFGIPVVWTRAFYERFLRAVRREASRTAADDGSFELGWTLTILTARAGASVRLRRRTARGRRASGSGSWAPRGG